MSDLAKEFSQKVYQAIDESISIGYHPRGVITMLKNNYHDAVHVAKILMKSGKIQSGFTKLSTLGRIDLSFESIILEPKFSSLFTQEELEAAKWHLSQDNK